MLRRILRPLLLALLVLPAGIYAQQGSGYYETDLTGYEDMADGEARDVPCPIGLAPRFHSYYGVDYEQYWFLTEWRSKLNTYPLPSWNWYYAYPNRNVTSTNGKARWEGAEIQVHCWVYRAMYMIQHHVDLVAAGGRLVELCEGGARTGFRREDSYDESGDGGRLGSPYYDPYAPSWSSDEFCSEDNDGEGGGGGTQYYPGDYTGGETVTWGGGVGTGEPSACGEYARVEVICIDVWVDGVGWVEWSCGYATTC